MLVENLGAVTLVNGLLRIETLKVEPNGEQTNSGEILIPANLVGPILDGLVNAAKDLETKLQDQIGEANEAGANGKKAKDKKKTKN